MTTTIKQHKENGYYVTMDIEKEGFYVVQVCPCHNNGNFDYCGYPEREMIYAYNERKRQKQLSEGMLKSIVKENDGK